MSSDQSPGLYPSSELESDIVLGGQNLKSLQRQFWVNINLPKFILTLPLGPCPRLLCWLGKADQESLLKNMKFFTMFSGVINDVSTLANSNNVENSCVVVIALLKGEWHGIALLSLYV